MNKRILLVNYDFPPALAGVRRMVKLTRYLPDHGFKPTVLCATPAAGALLDPAGLDEVPADCEVWQTPSPDFDHLRGWLGRATAPVRGLRQKFDLAASKPESPTLVRPGRASGSAAAFLRQLTALPDDRAAWLMTAIPMAEHLLKSRAIRYVLTSSYPNSTHLLGLYLKHRFRIQWHADFRDGWTQNPYFSGNLTPIHRRLNARLERQVVETADSLTAVSSPIVEHLRSLTDQPEKVYELPNGFDPTDLDEIPTEEFDRFTLAYTGTMFMQRSPDSFFAAVRGLLDSYPGLADNFQVILMSNVKPEHARTITELDLGHVVQVRPMGSWHDALSLQKSADALLVLEGGGANSNIMLTQKIFEYLATGKPVLAVAPEGALASLVRHTGAGVVVAPDNVFRIKETLFEMFLGRLKLTPRPERISQFTRQKQAADLAQILLRHTPHE